jgi:DNA-directed RNA polymerase subunit E'
MDDFVTVDPAQGAVIGKTTNRIVRVGDKLRARIVAVSPPKGVSVGKIGLTSRQPFLGKIEWIEEKLKEVERKEIKEPDK